MDKNELQFIKLANNEESGGSLMIGYLNNKYLYSSCKVDDLEIKKRKFKKLLSKIVSIFLITIALVGVIIAGYLTFIEDVQDLFVNNPVHLGLVKLFWITILFDLYLVYKISSENEKFQKIMKFSYENNSIINPQVSTLEQWNALKHSEQIDISRTFEPLLVDVMDKAFELATKYKHEQVTSFHFLLATLFIPTKVSFLIYRLGIDPQILVDKMVSIASRYNFTDVPAVFDQKANILLLKAYRYGYVKKLKKITPTEIFAVSFLNDENIQEVFYDLGVEIEDVKNTLVWLQINEQLLERYNRYKKAGKVRSKYGLDRALTSLSTQYLDKYSQDITRYAQNGYLELTVGRHKEIEEIFRIYQSGSNNIVLSGLSGTGKNAIIEGIAQKIVGDDVPEFLREKRIVSLDISSLVSGVNASQAQDRLLRVLNDAVRARNVILYIPNIHELVGISSENSQGLDLSSVLASVLEKNLLYCISTTLVEHYNDSISKSSLYSVLHKVDVNEMDEENTIHVLESKVGFIENNNGVNFSYQALKAIVKHSKRYVHNQFFPTKAILIMEELAVYVKNLQNDSKLITDKIVAEFLTQKLGIPIKDVDTEESSELLNLEEILHKRVVGQDEAVQAVTVALKRARTQLRDEGRPIASMLFLGPTGVGKTELVKAIAQSYFGDENNMIRLDMSEYQNSADIYKIIGSPSGSTEQKKGHLTQSVQDNPYTIILLDEFEKAHDDVLNIFLQVMEDGRLTDANGETVDFTNTIIVATSNAGSQFIQDKTKEGVGVEEVKSGLLEGELKLHFKPELLNRFDNIVVFKPLEEEQMKDIARLMIKKIADKLENKGIALEVTDGFIDELARKGYDPLYGARSLRRLIQDEIDNDLSDYLLKGKLDRRDVIVLDEGGEISVKKAEKL